MSTSCTWFGTNNQCTGMANVCRGALPILWIEFPLGNKYLMHWDQFLSDPGYLRNLAPALHVMHVTNMRYASMYSEAKFSLTFQRCDVLVPDERIIFNEIEKSVVLNNIFPAANRKCYSFNMIRASLLMKWNSWLFHRREMSPHCWHIWSSSIMSKINIKIIPILHHGAMLLFQSAWQHPWENIKRIQK